MGKWRYLTRSSTVNKNQTGFIINDGAVRICEGMISDKPYSPKAKRATGLLIAAAPDVLAALKAVIDQGLNRKTLEIALAAIGRAELGDPPSKSTSFSISQK